MFDVQNEQQRPYREAGYGALTNIKDMLPYFTKQPTAEDLMAMPGMQFGLTQGLGATREGLNVGGGGSNVTRGAIKFANDYGANVALPAYNKQRTDIYNTLASLAQIGQKSQGATSDLAQNVTSNIGQLGVGAAGALAGVTDVPAAVAGSSEGADLLARGSAAPKFNLGAEGNLRTSVLAHIGQATKPLSRWDW
jgi:hypothetical protein